jgi:hypothetical protein
MSGSAALLVLFLGTLLEALVVVCAVRRKLFRRYFFLNLYMILCAAASLGRWQILQQEGIKSLDYRYFYFYSDAVLTIALFFALISLYVYVFEEMNLERYFRLGAVVLLAGTCWFSYTVVSQSSHKMLTYFAFELSQNLYFVGLVLTYVLWGAILKLRETRSLLVQLVLSLGVFFGASAATYSVSNLHPTFFSYVHNMMPIMGCLLPLAWAYAFWRVADDDHLPPTSLSMVPR